MVTFANRFLALACAIAAWPQTAAALTYDIHLYRLDEIANKGITASVRETKRGSLDCTLRLDPKKMAARITSVELSSSTEHAVVDLELRPRETGDAQVCRFTLSRELLMHGRITIGIEDTIPGGTFYHVAFVDFIDFGDDLPPSLQRRQARLAEFELQRKLPRYEDSTPMRDDAGNPRDLLLRKTPIVPYSPSPSDGS